MTMSDFISIIAIVLSAIALFQTHIANRNQSRLTDREVELVRRQLDQFAQDERLSKMADLSARLFKEDKNNWKLRIANRGPATASNVRMFILVDQNSMFQENIIERVMPMKNMEKGAHVDIRAVVHFGTNDKEEIRLVWDDPSEVNREKTVEVAI